MLLVRLLERVGAIDLLLARGENTSQCPLVFAKLAFPYVLERHWLYIKNSKYNTYPFVFPISWALLEQEKNKGLKNASQDDIVNLRRGWRDLSVGLRSEEFQEHVLEKMLESADGCDIASQGLLELDACNIIGKDVFMPKARCLEEVKIWLDLEGEKRWNQTTRWQSKKCLMFLDCT